MSVKLEEVCSFLNGGTPSRTVARYFEGEVPWITGADINGPIVNEARSFITDEAIRHSATNLVPAGTVLLVTRTSVGKVAIAGTPLCFSQDITAITPDPDRVDIGYLVHLLRTKQPHFERLARGATIKGVTREAVASIRVPLPPLPEQRRIAEILDKADALRAKRRAALALLDTLTQSIFLDMFGDPATNPRGWPTRRLDATCALVNGRAFKPQEWEDIGRPIIRIQNLNDKNKPFNYTGRDLPERFRVRPGDILFSWSGTPGTSFGCFRWDGPEGWLNQHIFNVRLNDSIVGAFFIAHVNLKLGELISKAHGGVGLQHVTKGMVDETLLMMPPDALQVEFARRAAAVEALMSKLSLAQAEGEALFASIQHSAFRGDLACARVSEIAV